MSDIQTKVVLEVDDSKLKSGISQGINQATNQAQPAVSKGGSVLGTAMGKAFSAAFGAISLKALYDFANNSVAAYRQTQVAQATLTGSVQAYANRQQRAKEVIADTTKSYEEKALAIGYNVDQIYEEEKASSGLNTSAQALSRSIEQQERIFKDSTQAIEQMMFSKQREADMINRQISLLKKETEERVKLKRAQMGGDTLDSEIQSLTTQKDILDVQKAEAELAGDPILAFTIENQIKQLQAEIKLREEKLDVINNETQLIKNQAKTQEEILQNQADTLKMQVEDLRFQLSSAQNKFEIDIEPARRQLQDLQAAAQAVSGVMNKNVSKEFQDALDQASKANFDPTKQIEGVNKAVDTVYNNLGKKVGLTRGQIQKGASDLIQAGLMDIGEVERTLEGFIKISSQGSLGTADALEQLTAQFRTQNAALGERAGLQDEYISQIGPRGLAILQAEGKLVGKNYDQLTLEEQALAKSYGLRQNSEQAQASFNAKLEQGAYASDQNKAKLQEMQQVLGEELAPVQNNINLLFGDYLDLAMQMIQNNPGLATGLMVVAGAAIGLGTALMVLGGPATLAIAGIGLVIASVADAWNNNTAGIRDNASKLGEQVERIMGKMGLKMSDFQLIFQGVGTAFGVIGSVIGNVLLNVGGFVLNMVEGVVDIFSGLIKFFQGDFKGGMKDVFSGIARIIVNPFDFAAKTITDVLNALIDGFNKLNPSMKIPNIPRPDFIGQVDSFIQSFETGGFPQGMNAIVRTNEAGQEYIANARATDALATFFKEVGKDFGMSSSSVDNSDNRSYQQNNYGGMSNAGFNPAYSIT